MSPTENKLEDFAEELGKLLGTAEAKAKGWLGQREQIAKTLTGIRDSAENLLQELAGRGAAMAAAVQRGRRGRRLASLDKPGPGRPKGTRKRRRMSAEARAKIAAAQRARWARQKAIAKKK